MKYLTLFLPIVLSCNPTEKPSQTPPPKIDHLPDRTSKNSAPSPSHRPFSSPDKLKNLSLNDASLGAKNIETFLEQYPGQGRAIMLAISSKLAESNQLEAFHFLAHCQVLIEDANSVIAELAGNLYQKDPEIFATTLISLFDIDQGSPATASQILTALSNDPELLSPTEIIAWAERQGEAPLTAGTYRALIANHQNLNDQDFQLLKSSWHAQLERSAFQDGLAELGAAVASRTPDDVEDFVKALPGGLRNRQIAEEVMSTLGRENPAIASDWLSKDPQLEGFFRPDAEAERNIAKIAASDSPDAEYQREILKRSQEEAYDHALAAYIRGLAENHPDSALESLNALHSETLRTKLRNELGL